MIDTTVKALKELAAKILNDGSAWEDIPGETVVDVLRKFPVDNAGGGGGGNTDVIVFNKTYGDGYVHIELNGERIDTPEGEFCEVPSTYKDLFYDVNVLRNMYYVSGNISGNSGISYKSFVGQVTYNDNGLGEIGENEIKVKFLVEEHSGPAYDSVFIRFV